MLLSLFLLAWNMDYRLDCCPDEMYYDSL